MISHEIPLNIRTNVQEEYDLYFQLPKIGFGTYRVTDINVIISAISNGYQHFDVAELYKNEDIVRSAIDKFPDKKIYITTKISKKAIFNNKIEESFYERLSKFKYIDILLLHTPSINCKRDWDILVSLYIKNKDKIRYIGVSNYNVEHLEQILASSIQPYCNQIEITPFYIRKELVKYCRDNNILIISHTSLTRAERLDNHVLIDMSKKYNISTAKLLLKWAIQNNYYVIPKANSNEHQLENIFSNCKITINQGDMFKLDELNDNFHITKVNLQ